MKYLPILLVISFVGYSSSSYSQMFAPANKKVKEISSFTDMQRSFQEWRNQTDLKKVKGWKWYKRWEHYNETRADGDGRLYDPNIFFSEAIKISNQKKLMQSRAPHTGWSPAGPVELPPAPDGFSSHGMGRVNCLAFHPTDPNTLFIGVAQGGVWKSTNNGQSWTPLTDDLPILRISDIAIDPVDPDVMYIAVGDYAYLGVALHLDDRKRNSHFGLGIYKTTDGGASWNATGLTFNLTEYDQSLIRRIFINPSNTNELLAAGIQGIWKSSDGGTNWTKKNSNLIWDIEKNPLQYRTIYASTGYVKNLDQGNAGIMKSTDFGETWTTLNTGIPLQDTVQRVELSVSRADTNYVYAIACNVADRGLYAFYQSTNGGQSWIKKFDENSGKNILSGAQDGQGVGGQGTYDLAIHADHADKNKVTIGGVNLWGTSDGGSSWDGVSFWLPTNGDYVHADQHQLAYNPLNGYTYICNDGGIYRTNNIIIGSWSDALNDPSYVWPTTWENMSSGMQITSFYRLGINNEGDIIAGAQDNSTFYYNALNDQWFNVIGGDGMECAIDPNNNAVLYGSSQFGNFAYSNDGGNNFFYLPTPDFEQGEWTTPFLIDRDNSSRLYVGLENMHVSDDAGQTWNQISNFPVMPAAGFGAPLSHFAVAPENNNVIYAAKRVFHSYGEQSKLFVTTNGGTSWNNVTAGLPDSLYFTYIVVSDDDPQTAWVACGSFYNNIHVFKTTNAGATWVNVSFNLPNIPVNCLVLDESSAVHTLYAGTDVGVYYINDNLTSWQMYSNNLPNVIVSEMEINYSSKKLYAATFGRGIWVSDLVDNTGIENKWNDLQVKFYPTVNKGRFTLEMDNNLFDKIDFEIVNILGGVVHKETLNTKNNAFKRSYAMDLRGGMYFARLSNNNRTKTIKFVVE